MPRRESKFALIAQSEGSLLNGFFAREKKSSDYLKASQAKGDISFEKANMIANLPIEYHSLAAEKIVTEQLTTRETKLLVKTISEQPEQLKEILSRPIIELTPPPNEIQEFVKEYGSGQPKFESGTCPICGTRYVANWVSLHINWENAPDE